MHREDLVGTALSELISSGVVTRDEMFIQTKLASYFPLKFMAWPADCEQIHEYRWTRHLSAITIRYSFADSAAGRAIGREILEESEG